MLNDTARAIRGQIPLKHQSQSGMYMKISNEIINRNEEKIINNDFH